MTRIRRGVIVSSGACGIPLPLWEMSDRMAGIHRRSRRTATDLLAPRRRHQPGEYAGPLAREAVEFDQGDTALVEVDAGPLVAEEPADQLAEVGVVADESE